MNTATLQADPLFVGAKRYQERQGVSDLVGQSSAKRIPLAAFHDPVEWIQNEFYIPETGKPMELYPAQIEPLREALALENGQFKYSLVLWSAIKKSAKSSIAGGTGLWMGFNRPYSSIRVIGNDLKQSQSRVFEYMKRAIELNPKWKDKCKINRSEIFLPNHSKIEAVACDPSGEAGGGDDIVIYTELWAWKNEAAQKLWSETTLSPLKFGQSLRWAETYAGFIGGGSPVLEPLYENLVQNKTPLDAQYETYSNPSTRQFALWMTSPSLPWQTQEYYAQEEGTLRPAEFSRLHGNKWSASADQFVPDEWWQACASGVPPYEPNDPCIMAVDAAVSGDCFGVLVISGRGNQQDYDVRYARAWKPPQNHKLEYTGEDSPDSEIRRLCDTMNISEVAFDEFQLHKMMTDYKNEMLAHVYAFPQGKDRLISDKALQDAIRARQVHHSGEPDLKQHIQNADAATEGEKDKLRIVKRSDSGKIDLAVCLSMARARAAYWRL